MTSKIYIKNILYKTPEINQYRDVFNDIIEKHASLKDSFLCVFMYWLMNVHCEIYYYTYEKIYNMAGYKPYKNNTWILHL